MTAVQRAQGTNISEVAAGCAEPHSPACVSSNSYEWVLQPTTVSQDGARHLFEIWLAALQDLQGMPPEDGDGEAHVLEVVLAVRGVAVPIRDLDTALQHIGGSQRKASK